MEMSIKGNFPGISFMAMEFLNTKMVTFLKVNGKTVKSKEEENLKGMMG